MKIINSGYSEMGTRELYAMTKSPDIDKVSNHGGETVTVRAYVIFEDINKDTGEEFNILSVKTDECGVIATNSPTFINSFCELVDLCRGSNEEIGKIKIYKGASKAGRTFYDCGLV